MDDDLDNGVLVLLSGGIDSTVAMAHAKDCGYNIATVGFDYGQRHSKELTCAERLAKKYNASFTRFEIDKNLMYGCALCGNGDIPLGLSWNDPGQSKTVVHGRNMVLLSMAVSHALAIGCSQVWIGAHNGDHEIYTDCRKGFIDSICKSSTSAYGVKIVAPFIEMSKRDVVRLGIRLGVPFDMTWTCYMGGDVECGKCGACIERNDALNNCGA